MLEHGLLISTSAYRALVSRTASAAAERAVLPLWPYTTYVLPAYSDNSAFCIIFSRALPQSREGVVAAGAKRWPHLFEY